MESEILFRFLDGYLEHDSHPDYPRAFNGLQVEGPAAIASVAVAVDASEETIDAAIAEGADLLIVHHGLFWDSEPRVTGHRYRKLAAAIEGGLAVYASHLPLDAHPEVGNNVLLARSLGVSEDGRFGDFSGCALGVWGTVDATRDELVEILSEAVGGPARVVPGGPDRVARVGVVTGGGSSVMPEARAAGLDTLITGEAPHHAAIEARERGINLLLGGHYATETFGVRALGELIQERFGLPWTFIDRPTGF